MSDPSPAAQADYNLRILSPVARYFAEREAGKHAFIEICARHGVSAANLEERVHWISWDAFESIMRDTRDALESDEEFARACAYRMNDSYGFLTFLGWGVTPRLVYAGAERAARALSTAGTFEVVSTTQRSARLRYKSKFGESRLVCISRQAQCAALPGLFGLPEAHVREHSCIARGDDACEYEFFWMNRRKWTLPVLAAAIGAAIAYFVPAFGHIGYTLPLFGLLTGYLVERHRVSSDNERTMTEVVEGLRGAILDEAEVRRELTALQERNDRWARLLEQAQNERLLAMEEVAGKIAELQAEQQNALLGIGHDLRNPLTVLTAYLDLLLESQLADTQREQAREMSAAAAKMKEMLHGLMDLLRPRTGPALRPVRLATKPLVDDIRRRANAFVFGKDVRITVFATRECPDTLEIDPVAFDRIVDNLVSNAGKYTARGSIVIELDGTPDFFVLKIGDTGRGIDSAEMDRIFRPGHSDVTARAPDSYGIGLSTVVELLGKMGGRLEVMSKVATGTTFWAYLPVKPPAEPTNLLSIDEKRRGKHLLQVVQVRKHPA